MKLIPWIISIFGQGAGNVIGKTVTNVSVIAALTPIVIWLAVHKEENFVCLAYGELAFFGIVLAIMLKIAQYTRAGNPHNRGNNYH